MRSVNDWDCWRRKHFLFAHPTMNEEAQERFRKLWDERHQGPGNCHQMVILEEGMKFTRKETIAMTMLRVFKAVRLWMWARSIVLGVLFDVVAGASILIATPFVLVFLGLCLPTWSLFDYADDSSKTKAMPGGDGYIRDDLA